MKNGSGFIFYYLSIVFCILSSCNDLKQASQEDRPNIVWLVSEDNSKHYLRLYEEGGAPMPHIEALAKEGIVFENAFSNAPVCSVARSTIISGCYASRIGAQYHRKMQQVPMPDGLKMFPQYLREAGYYTTNNAKEDYNLIKPGKVWDESSKTATYKKRNAGQPFFHVQNYGGTHEGQLHFSKENMQSTNLVTAVEEVPLFPYHPDTPIFGFTNAYYRDLHQKVDAQMGDFIEELKKDGLMDDTIIFYYGDHGGALPRSKGYVYESGLNVPMVVYIPEKWRHLFPMKGGSRTTAFVQFIDLAPTILHLAGLPVPQQMDGKPFLGKEMTTKSLTQRDSTFAYADRFDEKYDLVRSFRKGKYKYIRNYQPFNIDGLFNFYRYKMLAYKEWEDLFKAGMLNEIQRQFFQPRAPEALYDIEKDPHEIHNLAKEPAYESIVQDLRLKLQKQVKEMPDLSFYPEAFFLENGLANPVRFGQEHKDKIAELVDIADLSLMSYQEAREGIENALKSNNAFKRYWALITCSAFGKEAIADFSARARAMAMQDNEPLVRMRGVEFLALNDHKVPSNLILEIVKSSKSETETNLILNSVALLKMVRPDFKINLPKELFDPAWIAEKGDLVNRRITYINGKN